MLKHFTLYTLLQNYVVPYEVQLVGVIVKSFGIHFIGFTDGMIVNGQTLRMEWNCLGWQSMILFFISSVIALRGGLYTNISKIEVIIVGIFGIFVVNLLRISFTVLLAVYSEPLFKVVFHDYLAAFVTIIYLFVFWWFAYKYILEERSFMVDNQTNNSSDRLSGD
jgi:exosortase/archaeosortase family protein